MKTPIHEAHCPAGRWSWLPTRSSWNRGLIVYAGTSRDLIDDPERIGALMGVAARGMT